MNPIMKQFNERIIVCLEERLSLMKDYLQMKFCDEDWQGVSNAAMDIREILSELKARKDCR